MAPQQEQATELHTLVRVAALLRLFLLLVCLLGFLDRTLSLAGVAAIAFVALSSMAVISVPTAPATLARHPMLIQLDAVVMTGLMLALGTENPLVLVALSTCVVLGVVLAPIPAALATIVMIGGYLFASFYSGTESRGFLTDFGFPVVFAAVVALGQVFRMLAERKQQSERAFADLVSGAAAAAERNRLARELHDSTAKTLQGLVLTAKALPLWIEKDPGRASAQADDIATAADGAIDRLRELLAALRHDDLAQPFHESLATLARDTTNDHHVQVKLDLSPVNLSAPDVRYELLAAAREALVNAVTHSGCDQITVTMRDENDELTIVVRDNGKGFSLDVLPQREREGHFGVRGYSERLEAMGGHAHVNSTPGAGTSVTLTAPLRGLREEIAHVG